MRVRDGDRPLPPRWQRLPSKVVPVASLAPGHRVFTTLPHGSGYAYVRSVRGDHIRTEYGDTAITAPTCHILQ